MATATPKPAQIQAQPEEMDAIIAEVSTGGLNPFAQTRPLPLSTLYTITGDLHAPGRSHILVLGYDKQIFAETLYGARRLSVTYIETAPHRCLAKYGHQVGERKNHFAAWHHIRPSLRPKSMPHDPDMLIVLADTHYLSTSTWFQKILTSYSEQGVPICVVDYFTDTERLSPQEYSHILSVLNYSFTRPLSALEAVMEVCGYVPAQSMDLTSEISMMLEYQLPSLMAAHLERALRDDPGMVLSAKHRAAGYYTLLGFLKSRAVSVGLHLFRPEETPPIQA